MIVVDKQPHSKLEDELQQAGPQCVVIIPDKFTLPVAQHSACSQLHTEREGQRATDNDTTARAEDSVYGAHSVFFSHRIKAMGTLANVHSKDHFTDYTKCTGSADTSRILP